MEWTFTTRDFLTIAATITGCVIWFEARLRHSAERVEKTREELRATIEAKLANEAAARAVVEREIAEHKLAIVREFRAYPTSAELEKAIEKAVDPMREDIRALRHTVESRLRFVPGSEG